MGTTHASGGEGRLLRVYRGLSGGWEGGDFGASKGELGGIWFLLLLGTQREGGEGRQEAVVSE